VLSLIAIEAGVALSGIAPAAESYAMSEQITKAIKALDGMAVCNLAEPSAGDLARIYEAYRKTFAENKRLREALEKIAKRPDLPNPEKDADWKNCMKNSSYEARKALGGEELIQVCKGCGEWTSERGVPCSQCFNKYKEEKENKMKFKNIEALGLTAFPAGLLPPKDNSSLVLAIELEKLLESAQVVYGCQDGDDVTLSFGATKDSRDTHSAKLLCIQKLVKGVSKSEIREVLEARNKNGNYDLLLQRILTEGISNECGE
jgi:hypothetical protein